MGATDWTWVALGAGFVGALLWWALSTRQEYKGSDPGRRFASNEVDRLLDSLHARRPKPVIVNPRRR